MKKILYITVLCLFLSAPALAQGPGGMKQGGPGMERGGPEMGMQRGGPGGGRQMKWWQDAEIVTKLGLTSEQVEKINSIATNERKKSIRLRADAELISIDLEEAMESDTVDTKKIESLIDQYTTKRGQIHKEHMLTLLKIRGVLSGDQYKKLQSSMQQHFRKKDRRHTGRETKGNNIQKKNK